MNTEESRTLLHEIDGKIITLGDVREFIGRAESKKYGDDAEVRIARLPLRSALAVTEAL